MAPAVDLASSPAPRVSIVVLGWREAPYLLDCLESLGRNCPGSIPFELLLFLNEPAPELRERVRDQVRGAHVAESPVNLGFGGGNNSAAAAARGEFIVLLNDDAVVEPGWLEALVEAAESHPAAGAVGSRVLAWDGTIQEAGGQLWQDASVTPLGYGLPAESSEFAGVRVVDFASGCSLLVRRDAWAALGGFDERFFPAYYEDVDLCLRLRMRGLDVLCAGRSVVRHRHSSSLNSRFKRFLLARHAALLRALHAGELASRPPPPEELYVVRERAPLAGATDIPRLAASAGGVERALLLERSVRGEYVDVLEAEADAREGTLLAEVERLRDWASELEQRVLQQEAELRRLGQERAQMQARLARREVRAALAAGGRLRAARSRLRRPP